MVDCHCVLSLAVNSFVFLLLANVDHDTIAECVVFIFTIHAMSNHIRGRLSKARLQLIFLVAVTAIVSKSIFDWGHTTEPPRWQRGIDDLRELECIIMVSMCMPPAQHLAGWGLRSAIQCGYGMVISRLASEVTCNGIYGIALLTWMVFVALGLYGLSHIAIARKMMKKWAHYLLGIDFHEQEEPQLFPDAM